MIDSQERQRFMDEGKRMLDRIVPKIKAVLMSMGNEQLTRVTLSLNEKMALLKNKNTFHEGFIAALALVSILTLCREAANEVYLGEVADSN